MTLRAHLYTKPWNKLGSFFLFKNVVFEIPSRRRLDLMGISKTRVWLPLRSGIAKVGMALRQILKLELTVMMDEIQEKEKGSVLSCQKPWMGRNTFGQGRLKVACGSVALQPSSEGRGQVGSGVWHSRGGA